MNQHTENSLMFVFRHIRSKRGLPFDGSLLSVSPLDLNDATFVAIASVILTLLRYSFQYYVQVYVEKTSIGKQKSLKYSESAWKLFSYSLLWIWGASITLRTDYFWDPSLAIANWPYHPMPFNVRLYYLTELSFYIMGLVTHLTIEVRRKDFVQMLFHHVLSIGLILVSDYWMLWKYGMILLFLHDINDVFLESGKLLIYSGYQKAADAVFGCLIVCWFITRIVIYPLKIINSSFIYGKALAIGLDHMWVWYMFNGFLFLLQGLNIMWFSMMIRLLCNVILKKGSVEDTREEDDEDDEVSTINTKVDEDLLSSKNLKTMEKIIASLATPSTAE